MESELENRSSVSSADDASEIEGSPFDSAILHDISWKFYRKLRRNHESRNVSMTYYRGELEIMAPFFAHERTAAVLESLVTAWTLELNVPLQSLGRTTLRRAELQCGFEPDASYYVQHEPRMWNKKRIGFKTDPPPDLAIEVDMCERFVNRRRLYSAFRIPELWWWRGGTLTVFELSRQGEYVRSNSSVCFPHFPISRAEDIVRRLGSERQTALLRSFRDFVRKNNVATS